MEGIVRVDGFKTQDYLHFRTLRKLFGHFQYILATPRRTRFVLSYTSFNANIC